MTEGIGTAFAFLFCSLGGYHEGPGGELGWGLYDEEFFDWNLRQTREVGALPLGRRTYEHFAEVWTSAEAAAFMNAVPETVVTSGGQVTPWQGTRVADGSDLDAEVARPLRRWDATGPGDRSRSNALVCAGPDPVPGCTGWPSPPRTHGSAGPWVLYSSTPQPSGGRGLAGRGEGALWIVTPPWITPAATEELPSA
ncbi:dihydrofolate reductase family protein [Streptomyces sp. 6N223]|uniref:dihydrofolate reductase family protein n=1 Tax=Streptomyces sp. 6N223 TaxID=3457412 RepID=UPI003FCF3757